MMKLPEAKEECQRWFAYHEAQDERAKALKTLAADRRTGKCDAVEGAKRRAALEPSGLSVYDGANLNAAVRVLLKALKDNGL